MSSPLRICILTCVLAISAPSSVIAEVTFNRDIRPILSDNCFFCHGPDAKKREADLRLDTFEGATGDLGGYAAIVPGHPEKSELIARVGHGEEDERMPPPKSAKPRLSGQQVDLLKKWIAEGARYEPHWAFMPIKRPAVPNHATHPIDAFIVKKQHAVGISPSTEADPRTLIRRMSLDLTGLLPEPKMVEQFVNAHTMDPDRAVTKLAELLLASPHYGERWGRHWLDQARYADSHGYSIDGDRQMWPYRDWVIAAHNKDMPFDQFTIEQIAGDLLPNATLGQRVASAFHRNTLINQEGGSKPDQFRNEAVVDRVNTTGAVWLGLTVGCSQCHTHKFDPITHKDYFRLFAFFNQGTDRNNNGKTIKVSEGAFFEKPKEKSPEVPAPGKKPEWQQLRINSATTVKNHALERSGDAILVLTDKLTPKDTFTVKGTTSLKQIAAVLLSVLPDKSLPKNGPGTAGNGNFVLSRFEVSVGGKPVRIVAAEATHSQPGYPITHAIDGKKDTGWAINVGKGTAKGVKMNQQHDVWFAFDKPVASGPVEIVLRHEKNEHYHVGKFSLAVSAEKPVIETPRKPAATGNLMVMEDLPKNKHRETFIHLRGDFLNPDKETGPLTTGVPEIFPQLTGTNHTRLDLAKWLVDPKNPLTARVTMNRIWMRYFGKGLVETENDFGTQGSLPTHPELLDWLATEFIRQGWSMKKMHKLIVTSMVYRQSSVAHPELLEKDPNNRLLARQNRIRVDAEIVRDLALSASGLFHPKIGGPSVYPPQPGGIYAFTQNRKNWKTSTGPDRYRRAMYTMFYRSAPYPTLTTFDSPNFATTSTSRVRSNTPLQSLTMANDAAMIELAEGLGKRIEREASEARGRIDRAFLICYSRPPSASEQVIVSKYVEAGATWKDVARVLMNSDEFITRE